MTKHEFAQCIAFLGASLDRQISAETHRAWFLILGDMEKRELELAIVAVLRGHKFSGLPPVGLLLQAAGASVGIVDADAQAVLAWDTAFKAISKHGGYVSVKWDDPAIPAAIETVAESWVTFCGLETAELIRFVKPKFIEAWKAHRAAGTKGDVVSLGILARDASRLGYESPEPLRIGEQAPAVVGFLQEKHAALPSPDSPRRLTVAASLADRMTVPPEETVVVVDKPLKPPKQPVELPSQEEWHGRLEAQKRALEVKYGLLEKVEAE
jgi:hypothetical protein